MERHTDNELFEMANLSKSKTGLNCIVWVQTNMPDSIDKHNAPRIKFSDNDTLIPVSISVQPMLLGGVKLQDLHISSEGLQSIFDWIRRNYKALMELWNGYITTDEFIEKMK